MCDEATIPLEEAVRCISWLPAQDLMLQRREAFAAGNLLTSSSLTQGHAVLATSHQYATGVARLSVNCVVPEDGEHTAARPGRAYAAPVAKGHAGKERA